jgi:hypothetical protein
MARIYEIQMRSQQEFVQAVYELSMWGADRKTYTLDEQSRQINTQLVDVVDVITESFGAESYKISRVTQCLTEPVL